MKGFKPTEIVKNTIQTQSRVKTGFIELGSLAEGGDEEIEERYIISKTKNHTSK